MKTLPTFAKQPTPQYHRPLSRLTLLVALLGVATPALAYLDPSTGSMILSAIIGMLATVGLAVKTYWYRLKGFFRSRTPDSRPPARTTSHGQDTGTDQRGQRRAAD